MATPRQKTHEFTCPFCGYSRCYMAAWEAAAARKNHDAGACAATVAWKILTGKKIAP